MAAVYDNTRVPCPGCPKMVAVDPASQEPVTCKGCGKTWRVELLDVPGGRFELQLLPAEA